MPRLSHFVYLQHRLALRADWLAGGFAFVVLTAEEQWAIHDFYEPTLDLSEDELRELRRRVTREQPSLPQRAGKAYARIAPFIGDQHPPMLGGTSAVVAGQRKGELRRLTVWGEVHPHVDPAAMAKILFDAMEQARRERIEQEEKRKQEKMRDKDQDKAA